MAVPISANTSADALRDVFWDRASLLYDAIIVIMVRQLL